MQINGVEQSDKYRCSCCDEIKDVHDSVLRVYDITAQPMVDVKICNECESNIVQIFGKIGDVVSYLETKH